MLLTYDLDAAAWVSAPGSRAEPSTPRFVRGDSNRIDIQFCRGSSIAALPSGAAFKFGLKKKLYGASVPYLVYDDSATISGSVVAIIVTNEGSGYETAPVVTIAGSGGATAVASISGGTVLNVAVTNAGSGYLSTPAVTIAAPGSGATATATAQVGLIYTFEPDFNTTELSTALSTLEELDCNMELQWTVDGKISSTVKLEVKALNDVNRGDEGAPVPAIPTHGDRISALELSVQPHAVLPRFFGKLIGFSPITIGMVGDSMITNKFQEIRAALAGSIGISGYALGGLAPVVAGGASTVSDFGYWINGQVNVVPNGGTVTFLLDGDKAVRADTIKIYFIAEPGSGTFTVQTSIDGGAYSNEPEGIGINTDAGSLTADVVTITKSSARGTAVRVLGTGGTVRILGAALYDSTTSGAVVAMMSYPGIDIDTMVTTPQSVVEPVMADLKPDLYFWEARDPAAFYATYFQAFVDLLTIGYAESDWVLIGGPPYSDPAYSAVQQEANAYLREFAGTNEYAYFDGYTPMGDGATMIERGLMLGDGVHLSPTGELVSVALMFAALGLDVARNGSRWDGMDLAPGVGFRNIDRNSETRFVITGPSTFYRGTRYMNDDGTQAGLMAFTGSGETYLTNGFLLSLGNQPRMWINNAGWFSFGAAPGVPASQFDFNVANSGIIGGKWNLPTGMAQDGFQWLYNGTLRGRITRDGLYSAAEYAKAALPNAANNARAIIYVSDDAGGATLAFSDGANWRRVADRAVVA